MGRKDRQGQALNHLAPGSLHSSGTLKHCLEGRGQAIPPDQSPSGLARPGSLYQHTSQNGVLISAFVLISALGTGSSHLLSHRLQPPEGRREGPALTA